MRNIFLLSLILLSTAAAARTAERPTSPGKGCINQMQKADDGKPVPSGAKRLDQLPPANQILTVIHQEGGCQTPVIVRHGIGGNPAAKVQPPAR